MIRKTGARLVYASSAATYGSSNEIRFKLGDEQPNNAYAFSKYVMDNVVLKILEKENLSIVGLRYFNVYGHGEKNKGRTASTVLQFYNQIKEVNEIKLFEGSENIFRDFVYIEDVINATYKAGMSSEVGIFNVGSGVARTFVDVASIVKSNLNSSVKFKFIENPFETGYQFYTCADIENTKKMLDYHPKFSLEDGILSYLRILENDIEK
jgi:ADP-L-glycero-D-manno-heptose 6-epimerase